jgi:hypothetical protein
MIPLNTFSFSFALLCLLSSSISAFFSALMGTSDRRS